MTTAASPQGTSAAPMPDRVRPIRHVPLSKLRQHPENPRKIGPAEMALLKAQLEADPDMLEARPLIALPDGTVIAGNQRLAAAAELGWKRVPVTYADLGPEAARVWMLRDNTQAGDWDLARLADSLASIPSVEQALTGLPSGLIDRALATVVRDVDPDEAPAVPAVPRSRLGEVYELGPHRLMCGDATDPAALETLLGDRLADLVWTDPPYGVNVHERAPGSGPRAARRALEGDDGDLERLGVLLDVAFRLAADKCRRGASWYVAAPMGPQFSAFTAPLLELGIWRKTLVWVKDSLVLSRADYHYRHEAILYGAVPEAAPLAPPELAYDDDGAELLAFGWTPGAGHVRPASRKQDTVWFVPRPKASPEHPTMKPTALVVRALLNSSRRGDAVLDPFAGSGSTLVASELAGRQAFLLEIDPAYCDVIRDRYAAFVGEATAA